MDRGPVSRSLCPAGISVIPNKISALPVLHHNSDEILSVTGRVLPVVHKAVDRSRILRQADAVDSTGTGKRRYIRAGGKHPAYCTSLTKRYAPFGTRISNRAPFPGTPVSRMLIPVMERISCEMNMAIPELP